MSMAMLLKAQGLPTRCAVNSLSAQKVSPQLVCSLLSSALFYYLL